MIVDDTAGYFQTQHMRHGGEFLRAPESKMVVDRSRRTTT